MKHVHVECLPDETLIRQLGCARKNITHHSGKSRVFKKLQQVTNELAMVDEDPGTAKTAYEKGLKFLKEEEGIKQYIDRSGNIVLILKGKLEDWILSVCKNNAIDITSFGLPSKPEELHEKINDRLNHFEKLISYMKQQNNSALNSLKDCLKSLQ